MFYHVGVGQAVQCEDEALLPVLVDLGDRKPCSSHHRCVFTRPLLQGRVHWCTMDAPQRQQQRQKHAVLHGKDSDCLSNTHWLVGEVH